MSGQDDFRVRPVAGDSPEGALVLRLADAMRDAAVGVIPAEQWDQEALGAVMTAGALFAGIIFGQAIAIGAARDGDRRRAGEGVVQNFRTGTDIGKRNAIATMLHDAGGTVQ